MLVALLLYVLFSSRPSSLPSETPTAATVPDTDAKASEVAETEKAPADKPDAIDGAPAAAEKGSLLGRKGKEIGKKPLKALGKEPASTGAADQGSEDAGATKQKSGAQTKPDEEADRRTPNGAAKESFNSKTAVAALGAGHPGKPGHRTNDSSFSASAIDSTTFHSAENTDQVLVVAFLGVECPLANLRSELGAASLAKHYRGKSVGVIAVNSNAQDTLEQARAQAKTSHLTFPVLKDAGNVVADLFGAERTPEVFVVDAHRTVRYRGMLDDQYGYRERRSTPSKTFVIDAVDALLKSEDIAVAETPVQGCHIGRVTKPSETAKTSYYHDVLPILQNRCQRCHRKGEIGPFALSDYDYVKRAIGARAFATLSPNGGCPPGLPTQRSASSPTTSASATKRSTQSSSGSMRDALKAIRGRNLRQKNL